jgi:hypothetical protein
MTMLALALAVSSSVTQNIIYVFTDTPSLVVGEQEKGIRRVRDVANPPPY